MKKILIIEDEYYTAQYLKKLINDYDNSIIIEGPLRNISEVVSTLQSSNDYDLILSDIKLQNDLIFSAFEEILPNSHVIFITAYDEYSMQAIKNNGVEYLLKPIDSQKLYNAIEKVKRNSFSINNVEQNKFKNMLEEIKTIKKRFLVKKGSDELKIINVAEISHFFKDVDSVYVVTYDGHSYPISMSMQKIEECLDPDIFFKLNRQYIAHVNAISKIKNHFNSKLTVKLIGCKEPYILISRDKSALLKVWLTK